MMCVILTNFLLNHFILFTVNRCSIWCFFPLCFVSICLFFVIFYVFDRFVTDSNLMNVYTARISPMLDTRIRYRTYLKQSVFNVIGHTYAQLRQLYNDLSCTKQALNMKFRSFYSFLDIDFPFDDFGNQS